MRPSWLYLSRQASKVDLSRQALAKCNLLTTNECTAGVDTANHWRRSIQKWLKTCRCTLPQFTCGSHTLQAQSACICTVHPFSWQTAGPLEVTGNDSPAADRMYTVTDGIQNWCSTLRRVLLQWQLSIVMTKATNHCVESMECKVFPH